MINLGIVLGLDATSTNERTTHGKKQRFHRHPKEFELLLVVFAAKLADTRNVVAFHGSEMSQPPPTSTTVKSNSKTPKTSQIETDGHNHPT
jgi:hypothetical protein